MAKIKTDSVSRIARKLETGAVRYRIEENCPFGVVLMLERVVDLQIDEFGAVCWPNGADLAPDAMHDELVKNDGLWTVGAEFAAS